MLSKPVGEAADEDREPDVHDRTIAPSSR